MLDNIQPSSQVQHGVCSILMLQMLNAQCWKMLNINIRKEKLNYNRNIVVNNQETVNCDEQQSSEWEGVSHITYVFKFEWGIWHLVACTSIINSAAESCKSHLDRLSQTRHTSKLTSFSTMLIQYKVWWWSFQKVRKNIHLTNKR